MMLKVGFLIGINLCTIVVKTMEYQESCDLKMLIKQHKSILEECREAKRKYEKLSESPWLSCKRELLRTCLMVTQIGLYAGLGYTIMQMHRDYCAWNNHEHNNLYGLLCRS